jgi:hypothetical protein
MYGQAGTLDASVPSPSTHCSLLIARCSPDQIDRRSGRGRAGGAVAPSAPHLATVARQIDHPRHRGQLARAERVDGPLAAQFGGGRGEEACPLPGRRAPAPGGGGHGRAPPPRSRPPWRPRPRRWPGGAWGRSGSSAPPAPASAASPPRRSRRAPRRPPGRPAPGAARSSPPAGRPARPARWPRRSRLPVAGPRPGSPRALLGAPWLTPVGHQGQVHVPSRSL